MCQTRGGMRSARKNRQIAPVFALGAEEEEEGSLLGFWGFGFSSERGIRQSRYAVGFFLLSMEGGEERGLD